MVQQKTNPISIHEDVDWIHGFTQWVRDPVWPEVSCSSQIQLGSHVAVTAVLSSSYSSGSTPSLETSICRGCDPEKQKTKTKKTVHFHPAIEGTNVLCFRSFKKKIVTV